MKIKHYDIVKPKVPMPSEDWHPCWYGLGRMEECYAPQAYKEFKMAEEHAHKLGVLGERELEVDIFLSILADIKVKKMVFMELGAGYADWCLALNGVIFNKIVNTMVKSTLCYAVEAEPTHAEWALKHFKQWSIKGEIIPCVVSNKNGYCRFSIDGDPSSSYGQSVTFASGFLRTMGNLLRRRSVRALSLTLDALMQVEEIERIDLVDMDVQGNEVRVVDGAKEAISAGKIDYWKIGVHGKKQGDQLRKRLIPYYDLVVDIAPFSIGRVGELQARVEDGIQLYKRR